jgi:hypothetical protein
MHKPGYNPAHKLGTNLAQVLNLSTPSTDALFKILSRTFLYRFNNTAPAQKTLSFAQPKKPVLNLLLSYLYPSSTGPITNTKLINKELYS